MKGALIVACFAAAGVGAVGGGVVATAVAGRKSEARKPLALAEPAADTDADLRREMEALEDAISRN